MSGCSGASGDESSAGARAALAEHFAVRGAEADGTTMAFELHLTPDYSDMSVYGGKYASGELKRSFVNRKGETIRSPYGNKYKFNNKPNG